MGNSYTICPYSFQRRKTFSLVLAGCLSASPFIDGTSFCCNYWPRGWEVGPLSVGSLSGMDIHNNWNWSALYLENQIRLLRVGYSSCLFIPGMGFTPASKWLLQSKHLHHHQKKSPSQQPCSFVFPFIWDRNIGVAVGGNTLFLSEIVWRSPYGKALPQIARICKKSIQFCRCCCPLIYADQRGCPRG